MARSSAQSAQRYPLTALLGAEAHVRLLRALSRHGGQLSAPALVLRTGLGKTSVWAGLAMLEQAGIVVQAGSLRVRLYSLRADPLLRPALDALFAAEERRFEAIVEAVREAARGAAAGVVAVWLYGSVARGEDRPGSDLDIAIVAMPDALAAVADSVRDALHVAGGQLGFAASVVGLAVADVARLAAGNDPWWCQVARDAVVLAGPRPVDLARSPSADVPGRHAA